MIGKILADSWGWTEKLGGVKNETVKITTEVKDGKLRQLKKDIQDCNTTAQVDVVIKEHGLFDIEGLPQHIKELYEKGKIGKLKTSDINGFIQTQNYTNIANQAQGYKGVNAAIEEYNKLTDAASKSKLAETISTTNTSLGKYLTGLKDADAGIIGYAGSLITATAKTFLLEAATTTLNAIMSMGISFLVSGAVSLLSSWVDNVIHATEKIREASDGFIESIQSFNNGIADGKSKLSDIADRYNELAEGVGDLGQNISLTADEYEEYKSLVSQVSDIMPGLNTLYDSQGNKIKIIGENLKDINKEYEKYVQNSAIKFLSEGDDEGNTVDDFIKNLNQDSRKGYKLNSDLKTIWEEVKKDFTFGLSDSSDILTPQNIIDGLSEIKGFSREEMIEYFFYADRSPFNFNGDYFIAEAFSDLLDKNYDDIIVMTDDEFKSFQGKIDQKIAEAENVLKNNRQNLLTILKQYAFSSDDYYDLEKEQRDTLSTVLNTIINDESIDELFKDEDGKYVDYKIQSFSDDLIKQFQDDSTGVSEAFSELISFDLKTSDKGILQAEHYFNRIAQTVADNTDLTSENIRNMFNFDDYFSNADVYTERLKNHLNSQDKSNIFDLSYTDLEIASEKLEIPEGVVWSWEQLTEKIKEYKYENSTLDTSNVFALKDSDGKTTALGEMSEAIDEAKTAYTGLNDAIESYNSSGTFTIDQIQNILSYGDDYLQYLINENGELELNKQKLADVAYARMQEMKAKVLSNMMDRIESIQNEASANEYLAESLYKVADASTIAAETRLIDWYSKALGEYGISEDTATQVRDKVANEIKAVDTMFNSVDFNSAFGTATKGVAEQSTGEAASAFKNLMDAELKVLDARMEAGLLKYDDYLKQRLALIESYKGKISDADYYSALSDNYENELSYMDKALNAVKRAIEKKIESYNDEIEALEEAHDKKIKLIDNEIQKLEDQKEALQDENDTIEKQLSLEQSLYDLERAQTQKTKMVYTGDKGYVYTTDQDAIRDAQEAVRQSKLDIQISKIDDAIEKLQEEQETLEKKLDLEREAIEKNIEDLKEYQSKWEEITSKYSEEQEDMVAVSIWGKDWESVILTDRTTALTNFTNTYMELQQNQANAALMAAEAIEEAERRKAVAEGSGTNDSNSITDTNVPSNNNVAKTGVNAAVTAAFATIDAIEYPNKRYYVFDKYGNYKSAYDSELEARKYQLTSYIYDTTDKKFLSKASSDETTSSANKKIRSFLLAGNKYHTGLDKGLVGKNYTSSADLETLQKYSLAQNEVPALLKLGEAVITQEQMANIADNLRFLDVNPFENMQLPEFNYDLTDRVQYINFCIGDINLNNVQNIDSLSDAIIREFPNKILQRIHKR